MAICYKCGSGEVRDTQFNLNHIYTQCNICGFVTKRHKLSEEKFPMVEISDKDFEKVFMIVREEK